MTGFDEGFLDDGAVAGDGFPMHPQPSEVGGMVVRVGDRLLDIGGGEGPELPEGVADSVTIADDEGLTIYTDADGDGAVDEITQVRFDGTWASWDAPAGVAGQGGDGGSDVGGWATGDWELREMGHWD